MYRLTMKRLLSLFLVLPLGICSAAKADTKPNFLFIISDDQAPTMVGALGNPEIKTPHLDTLVKRGTTFTHCFNQGSWSGAVCVASRTMLITGQTVYRAPQNKSYLDKWAHARGELAVKQTTAVKLWPQVFREAGYQTFLTGKWHNNAASVLQGSPREKRSGKASTTPLIPPARRNLATCVLPPATTIGLPRTHSSMAIGLPL